MKHNYHFTSVLAAIVAQFVLPLGAGSSPEGGSRHNRFPDYDSLAHGVQQVRLLPGCRQFTYTMYGAPGDVDALVELVTVMRNDGLGNGFDPVGGTPPTDGAVAAYLAHIGWPSTFYSGAEMQIKGGRGVFGADSEMALAPMRAKGLFHAVQLGEWGYYLHNLSNNDGWWRGVYGKDYDTYKHLEKPAGLAGYDQKPANKQACYDFVKDYFTSRQRDLLGGVISVTGHSHYEAYAAEWGASCVGLEVGENIAFTQSKLAFARGAARQWHAPWSVQVSPWFGPSVTTSGPMHTEDGIVRGMDAGHSLSFYERMWLHAWFAGAAMVTPENSIATSFEKPEFPWKLTTYGRLQAKTYKFMMNHDRGIPYTPVAVVLDHLAGYNGYMDKPWGILDPTEGDRQLRDLFDYQLFPGADHIHRTPDPTNREASYLRPTPYGESFDVFLSSAGSETLSSYPVILLAGDINFDTAFVSALEESAKLGSKILMSREHRLQLGKEYGRLARLGKIETLDAWTNPETGRSAAISNERLTRLKTEYLPFSISGDAVEYAINRTPIGWVVELINNRGVVKSGDKPAVTDPTAIAHVKIGSRVGNLKRAFLWKGESVPSATKPAEVAIGPGTSEFVEFITR